VIRYLNDAKENTEVESDEGLLIIFLDNSIPNRKGIEDRTNRIRNLTRTLTSLPQLLAKNVPIYILPLSIAHKGAVFYLATFKTAKVRRNVCEISELIVRSNCHFSLEVETDEIVNSYASN
jgi:hypothetical protein